MMPTVLSLYFINNSVIGNAHVEIVSNAISAYVPISIGLATLLLDPKNMMKKVLSKFGI